MQIRLERHYSDKNKTLGMFLIDGILFSFCCEDPYQEAKIKGITRIPAGVYQLEKTFSPRFNKNMWEVLNVPGFTGIRIHTGNKPEDTEGCLLPNFDAATDGNGNIIFSQSTLAYNKLLNLLDNAKANDEYNEIIIVDTDKINE